MKRCQKPDKKVAKDPTDDNNINLKKAAAKLTVETNKAVSKSWHEKTESVKFDKEGSKLWRLVKALNGDHDCKEAHVALEQDGETLNGKDAANVLLKQYQNPGQPNFNQEKITAAEEEVQRALTTTDEKEPAHEVMRLPLTAQELDTALSKLKSKSTPGPDKVSNDMLCKLGIQARKSSCSCTMPAGNRDTSQRCGKKESRSPSTSLGSPKTCQKATAPLALRAACANWWRGS